jgi:ketosteroid isomerase-like protein
MKRKSLLVAAVLSISTAFISACQPAAPDTNRNATAVATPTPVDKAAIEAEIKKLESDWAAAVMRHDAEAARNILADDLVLTYPDGNTGTKSSELADIAAGAMTAEQWEIADPRVTVLDADTAFITGRGVLKNAKYKDPKSKTTVDVSGQYRFTDVYEKRNGKWQAVASHTTKIQNPPAPSPSPSPSKTQ